jgi:hypothetical protein
LVAYATIVCERNDCVTIPLGADTHDEQRSSLPVRRARPPHRSHAHQHGLESACGGHHGNHATSPWSRAERLIQAGVRLTTGSEEAICNDVRLHVGETPRLTGLPAWKGSDLSVHPARAPRACVVTQTASPPSGVQGPTALSVLVVDRDSSFRQALRQTKARREACPLHPVHAVGADHLGKRAEGGKHGPS